MWKETKETKADGYGDAAPAPAPAAQPHSPSPLPPVKNQQPAAATFPPYLGLSVMSQRLHKVRKRKMGLQSRKRRWWKWRRQGCQKTTTPPSHRRLESFPHSATSIASSALPAPLRLPSLPHHPPLDHPLPPISRLSTPLGLASVPTYPAIVLRSPPSQTSPALFLPWLLRLASRPLPPDNFLHCRRHQAVVHSLPATFHRTSLLLDPLLPAIYHHTSLPLDPPPPPISLRPRFLEFGRPATDHPTSLESRVPALRVLAQFIAVPNDSTWKLRFQNAVPALVSVPRGRQDSPEDPEPRAPTDFKEHPGNPVSTRLISCLSSATLPRSRRAATEALRQPSQPAAGVPKALPASVATEGELDGTDEAVSAESRADPGTTASPASPDNPGTTAWMLRTEVWV